MLRLKKTLTNEERLQRVESVLSDVIFCSNLLMLT